MKNRYNIYVPSSHHSALYKFGNVLHTLGLNSEPLKTVSNNTSNTIYWQRFKDWRQVFEAYEL